MATMDDMDSAAEKAAGELEKLPSDKVMTVAEWWNGHFRTAGHRRLGKLMIAYYRQNKEELVECSARVG